MTCTGGLPSRNMKSAMSFRLHTPTRATSWRRRPPSASCRSTGGPGMYESGPFGEASGGPVQCHVAAGAVAVSSWEHPGRRSSAVPVQQVDRDGCSALAARPHTFRCAR
jgi:hypothetical protein